MERIAARKTRVELIDFDNAQAFMEENHDQKSLKSNYKLLSLGLFNQEELIGVIQFSYPRTAAKQREYSSELLRLSFKKEVRVIGGASKLIKHYINNYNPADIFTYQDTTGENTDVYAHAGFRLVSQSKKKQYLVAPGKTIETGNRKEVLGMPYATRWGPDRTIGTKLGELFDDSEKRKSNKQLFLDLGWHVEETSGDKVWEWFNPNMTHYVYKITAVGSDKYYFGVSHIKKANGTEEDCLNDGYFGSGSSVSLNNKFINWKKTHENELSKEIIKIVKTRAEAYLLEELLIGNSYSTDPLCLNSVSGGKEGGIGRNFIKWTLKHCNECKKETKHNGDSCARCYVGKSNRISNCGKHGETKFVADKCRKCISESKNKIKNCLVHGETVHQKNSCFKCQAAATWTVSNCEKHGETIFNGESCAKCNAVETIEKLCSGNPEHGITKHQGGQCRKCVAEATRNKKFCQKHDEETWHQGDRCALCNSEETWTMSKCITCKKDTPHQGSTCRTCQNRKSVTEKFCIKCNKNTKHKGDGCYYCNNAKTVNLKECSKHGLVKHQGESCSTCNSYRVAHKTHHVNKNIIKPDCEYC